MAVLERVVVDGLAQGAVPPGYTFTRSTTALYVDSDGLLKSAAINTPRRQWDATNRRWGYVGEGARTNECLQSATPTSGTWAKTNATVTGSYADGPGGTLTASRVQFTAAIGAKLDQLVALTTGTASKTVTHQVWMRSNTGSSQSVQVKNSHGAVLDNYSTVTVTTAWQMFRLTVTNSASAGSGNQIVGIYNHEAVAKDLLVWHQQTEQAAAPSSPIPTTTVAVTRGADLLTRALTGPEGTALSTQGTMVVEFSYLGGGSGVSDGSRVAMSCDDGTSNNAHIIYNGSGTAGRTTTATSAQGTIVDGDAIAVGSIVRAAYAWSSGRLNLAVDGVVGTADTTTPGGMPVVTTLGIGLRSAGGNTINGLIYGWTIYDDAKTDAELQALTTPTTNRNQSRLTLGLGLGL